MKIKKVLSYLVESG